jgi:hypothetical protein
MVDLTSLISRCILQDMDKDFIERLRAQKALDDKDELAKQTEDQLRNRGKEEIVNRRYLQRKDAERRASEIYNNLRCHDYLDSIRLATGTDRDVITIGDQGANYYDGGTTYPERAISISWGIERALEAGEETPNGVLGQWLSGLKGYTVNTQGGGILLSSYAEEISFKHGSEWQTIQVGVITGQPGEELLVIKGENAHFLTSQNWNEDRLDKAFGDASRHPLKKPPSGYKAGPTRDRFSGGPPFGH